MQAVADCREFLAILVQSKLVDDDVIARLQSSPEQFTTPVELAEQLIQQGVLTRFQSKQLLAGRYRGFLIGPYRILDQIGRGGMGTVYLGQHATLKKRVAIKVLSKELADDPKAVERFQREARAASSLAHGNIVRVHHVGNSGGTHFIVMEYVEGATVEQVIDRKGPFSFTEAAQIALQAAAGLQHAHERGFVHRDIKPENLMITKDGTVKILDMGLTKSITNKQDNLTGVLNTNAILGTIDYLSPEQAMQSEVDARSDIYSLGATLFTLLTGHSPYEGIPAKQKLLQHQVGAVPLLTQFRSDIPEELSKIVAKMMAKKPEDRFQTAADVAVSLLAWTSRNGVSGNQLELPSRLLHSQSLSGIESMTPTVRDSANRTSGGTVSTVRTALPEPVSLPPISNANITFDGPGLFPEKHARRIHRRFWVILPVIGVVMGLVIAGMALLVR